MLNQQQQYTVAIGSIGTVGLAVARQLAAGVRGLHLVAVSARRQQQAKERVAELGGTLRLLPLEDLAAAADVVVECAPAAVFRDVAEPAINAGKIFIPISVGALLSHWDLVDLARDTGARIIVPSGAILGLDAVRAAREGDIHSVKMVTRKPPKSLRGAPYLVDHAIDVDQLSAPTRVFDGTAREAALGFPANVNVGAALALAGIGPDKTQVEIWADPTIERNTHQIVVDADSARFELKIENVPSDANPATGRIVSQSVIAALRTLTAPLVVGA